MLLMKPCLEMSTACSTPARSQVRLHSLARYDCMLLFNSFDMYHNISADAQLQKASAPDWLIRSTATTLAAGLFTAEEQTLLLDQIRPWLSSLPHLGQGRRSAWEAFIGRARHHLHVVFATSPVGEAFRVRWVSAIAVLIGCKIPLSRYG